MDSGDSDNGPRVIGITGPIGCGKSIVGNILLRLGALRRIDADEVVHALMRADSSVISSIAEAFGPEVLQLDGSVDRARLAAIVFDRGTALRQLEQIVHPAVRQAIRREVHGLVGQKGVVVVDAIKLLQSDLLALTDEVWVVHCPPGEQLRRLVKQRGMTSAQAAARIRVQPSFEHPRVTRVIENTGTEQELEERVRNAWNEFTAPSAM